MLDRDEALGFAEEIERAVEARTSLGAGGGAAEGYYEEFDPGPPGRPRERARVGRRRRPVGGRLAEADVRDARGVRARGLRRVIHGYLGEDPAISIQKCTMRKVEPDTGTGWHQDGAFLGEVRALNVWVALSRCGDEAPGLDVVAKRLDEIAPTGTEGAIFDWSVAPDVVERVAGPAAIVRPIFEPGDAILFDEMNLHSTAADPSMPNPRYAIESWFFGLSGFPAEYVPIAY